MPSKCIAPARPSLWQRSRPRVCARAVAATNTQQLVATYTPYEANTWLLELPNCGAKVLADPWLVDKLTFGDQKWFFEGEKPGLKANPINLKDVTEGVDLILLSQSLNDHTHEPTLALLPKDIPVVAGPVAADMARALGYTTVHSLDHDDQVTLCDGKLVVKAFVGALVGPPWSKRQNAWLLQECTGSNNDTRGLSVFYEPHASYDATSIKRAGRVDVVILPTTSTYAAGYPLVEGQEGTPELLRILQPKVVLPLVNDTVEYTGALAQVLSGKGDRQPSLVEKWLQSEGITGVTVAGPMEFGVPVNVKL